MESPYNEGENSPTRYLMSPVSAMLQLVSYWPNELHRPLPQHHRLLLSLAATLYNMDGKTPFNYVNQHREIEWSPTRSFSPTD